MTSKNKKERLPALALRLVRRNAWVMWMGGGFSAAGWHWNDWRFYAVLVPVCILNGWAKDAPPNKADMPSRRE